MLEQNYNIKLWECKECHKKIKASDSVAFHLVDGFLYGWCRSCFDNSMLNRSKKQLEKPIPRMAELNTQ
jgi:hypothetical protein